ncbi:periplasmic glycine betaine/choline-binding (lipo)protein of an ABC-type transport system (osmoprotectant binding protein) [Terriglobus roseus DSM 18391]|uniref:Periplasmic glycine betaine/choline-binding (Lipo)protein of an ABC-type transport system (Osmoprotectant binding protein) n=2 Tax=Terriglobus roseus TaxID=392734 RepID=I3ZEQ3_TERRK|nr:periplasmic glycine betaine/choline-binding (lipo)protein of an ABC-type transport system (osmoprotectant binding protein) [Terriglobus roseus DSM 18391]
MPIHDGEAVMNGAPNLSSHSGLGSMFRVAMTLVVTMMVLSFTACDPPHGSRIVIGAKNFTEQVILGELLAQEIEATGEKVDRRFYLAGSYIAHQALVAGRIDAYVEYTGTALTSVLKQPLDHDPDRVLATVRRIYAQKYAVRVQPSLGFENTFAMVLRGADADRLHVSKLSDLSQAAPTLRLGVGYEFEERPDGLHGMDDAYGLRFDGTPRIMDLGLLYRALGSNQVDVISGNSTDGQITAMDLRVLTDDRRYFPPYQAVPLVREDTLRSHPKMQEALDRLTGRISESEMQAMNHAVEGDHRDPADVVRDFRKSHGL